MERAEADLLLLAVRLNGETINEGLAAYPLDKSVVLPLGELSRELGFGISVDIANGIASGFFINETRRFELNVRKGKVTVQGRETDFDRAQVEIHQDDIYVDAALLSKWFPVDFSVDLYASLLIIRPREPLPLMLRKQREDEVRRTLASLGYSGPKLPFVRNPYAWFSGPFIDQQLRLSSQPSVDGSQVTAFQYSTLLTGDVFGLEGNAFLIGDETDPLSDFRAGLGRRSPRPELLGPLRAREFGIGEVLFPGSELVSFAASGPGLLLSNFPLEQQGQFDQHTFIGDLPLGWEVELYRNDALIAYAQSSPEGRYMFQNVPLLFGLNVIKLIFYGPQGQRRIEVETFNIGETLTPPGQLHYRLAANDPQSLTRRALLETAYGVTDHLSAHFSSSYLELIDRDTHRYDTASLRTFWSRFFAYADVGRMSERGSIARVGVNSRIGGLSFALSRAHLDDYESEVFRPLFGQIRRRTNLRLSGLVRAPRLPLIPLSLDVIADDIVGGGRVYQLSNSVSVLVARTSITNRVDGFVFRSFAEGGAPQDSLTGAFLVSRFVRRFAFRGQYDYVIRPEPGALAYGVTGETRIFPEYLLSAQLLRSVASRTTHYIASVSRDQGKFAFGVEADITSTGDVSLRLAVAAGIHRDPFTGAWRLSARPVASQGALAARVFLDTNGNGVWDAGEKPVSGAGFFVNRAADPHLTDETGRVVLPNLPPYRDMDISISPATLEDPLFIPLRPGVRFVPRPGKALPVDFPVLVSGEITGTVYIDRGSGPREAPGLIVQLIDAQGNVARQERTAYDGFYDLTNIVPGSYTLRVESSQPERVSLAGDTRRPVTITANGTVLDGVNFTVKLPSSEPVVVAEASPPTARSRVAETTTPERPVVAPPAAEPPPAPSPTVVEQSQSPAMVVAEAPRRAPVAVEAPQPAPVVVETPRFEPPPRVLLETPPPAPPPIVVSAPAAPRAIVDPVALVRDGSFREALDAFEAMKPISAPDVRYFYAVALYETGRYAAAKNELRSARLPDTNDAARYRAKIEGAIVPGDRLSPPLAW